MSRCRRRERRICDARAQRCGECRRADAVHRRPSGPDRRRLRSTLLWHRGRPQGGRVRPALRRRSLRWPARARRAFALVPGGGRPSASPNARARERQTCRRSTGRHAGDAAVGLVASQPDELPLAIARRATGRGRLVGAAKPVCASAVAAHGGGRGGAPHRLRQHRHPPPPARQREMAIRLSLGAGRARVIRQLLTESVLLALIGALLGALFARWADRLIVAWISTRHEPASLDLSLDWRVLGFMICAALVTALLFGLLPAWRATRVDTHTMLKSGGRGLAGNRRQRMSRPLVAAQLALSLALVTGAGLLLTTFRNLDTVDPGFRRDGVYIVQTDFAHASSDTSRLPAMEHEALQRLSAIPGVRSVSQSAFTAMSGAGWNDLILAPGWIAHSSNDSLSYFNEVNENFFSTMGMPLLAGRTFTAVDGTSPINVAIVTRTMARRFFGTDNALGRMFRTPVGDTTSPPYQVVGVVGDSKYNSLDEETNPIVYLPLGARSGIHGWTQWNYEIRSDLPMSSILPAARDAVAAVSPAIELDATTVAAQVEATLARPRLLATLSSFFGALALVLAVVGLYGTLAYDVSRRRNEIGIRMALGAAWRDVVRLVLGDAGWIVGAGIAVGAVLSLAGSHLVSSLLYGVAPQDVRTLVAAILVLASTALIATMLPAWRAARTAPTEALRDE